MWVYWMGLAALDVDGLIFAATGWPCTAGFAHSTGSRVLANRISRHLFLCALTGTFNGFCGL